MCVVMMPVVALTACNPAHVAKQAKKDVDNGNAAACTLERADIQKAVENFTLLNPDTPVTEAGLVAAGLLHSTSVLMDVTADGTVVPAAGSVCA
jgi:hypothetical protein